MRPANRASRAVISGLFSISGQILPTCHYMPRGGKAIAPKAWVRCEATEACTTPMSPALQGTIKAETQQEPWCGNCGQGIEATMLVPLANATTRPRVPRTRAICHLWVGEGEGVAVFDAYVEAHITDVQHRGRVCGDGERTVAHSHSPGGPCVVH
jgi:hypothetical protein